MKKLLFSAFILLLVSDFSFAQKRLVDKSFPLSANDKIRLNLRFGDLITITSWERKEISFKAVIEINRGKLNEALVLDFSRENGRLNIASDFNEDLLKNGRREDCPQEYSQFSGNSDDGSYVICSDIRYEIRVPRSADIEVETISGDIELINLSGPLRASSISGFVDLSWPRGQSARLRIKTVTGEAYTNLDNLHIDNKKDHIPLVGYELKGRIGKGGPLVVLESVSGDIYLREE